MSPSQAGVDARLLEITVRTIQNIPDVLAAFGALDQALPDADGLKWFNGLYLHVTRSVDQSIGTLQWRNPAWLARLDVLFARLYLNAMREYLTTGATATKCWQALFESRRDARLARIQFALAGMNAHIDHDLAVAVVSTSEEFGTVPLHNSPEYLDYTQVNGILNTLIESSKRDLMVGLLGNALPSVARVEDLVGAFGILSAREAAWTNAELLWHVRGVPGLPARFLAGADGAAALAGRSLLLAVGPAA